MEICFCRNGGNSKLNLQLGGTATITGPSLPIGQKVIVEVSANSGGTISFYINGVVTTAACPSFNLTGGNGLAYTGDQRYIASWLGYIGDQFWSNTVLSSADRNSVGSYLQTQYGISGSYVGVPEPSTLVLLGAGLLGLLCYAWRKRK